MGELKKIENIISKNEIIKILNSYIDEWNDQKKMYPDNNVFPIPFDMNDVFICYLTTKLIAEQKNEIKFNIYKFAKWVQDSNYVISKVTDIDELLNEYYYEVYDNSNEK